MENKRNCCCDLWSQLQQDIVDLILERIGALDRISFGAVCTRWRAAVARSTATSTLAFPFVLHAACRFPDETHSLTSLEDNRVYYLNPSKVGGTVLDVIEGRWLIMCEVYLFGPKDCSCERQMNVATEYSILNPVTRKEFLLPRRMHPPPSDTCDVPDLPCLFKVMRANNSEPTTSSNFLVAGLSSSGSLVGFCRLTDSEWSFINLEDKFKDLQCQDIMFCRGRLYALIIDVEDFIIAFDYDDNKNGAYINKIVMKVPWQISLTSSEVRRLQKGLVSSYSFYNSDASLATDSISGELLLIVRDIKFLSKKSPPDLLSNDFCEEHLEKVEVVSLSVYRLYMNNDEGQWIKVADLGDRILFNGNRHNFFLPTKAFEESTHQGNCIYYAFSANDDCWDIGEFDLNNQIIIPCPIKRRKLAPAVGWLAPQFRKCEL